MSDTRASSRVVHGDGGGVQEAFDDELCLKCFLSFSLPFSQFFQKVDIKLVGG